MAQQLDEAFAGCDQWTARAAAQRRSSIDFSPRASSSSRMIGSAAAVRTQEPARAVVVGVVQKEDVPGPGVGGCACARSSPASPGASSPSPTATTAPGASRGFAPPAGRRR